MAIQELYNFRAKYPEYSDMSDADLAKSLAIKYPDAYGDLPGKLSAVVKKPSQDQQIQSRPSAMADLIKNPTTLKHPVGAALRTLGGAAELYRGVPASIALDLQKGRPQDIPSNLGKVLTGQRPAKYGDVYKGAGVPSALASGAGLYTDVVLSPGGTEGTIGLAKGIKGLATGGIKNIGKLKPIIYNDKFITDTASSIISKVNSKIEPLREMYKAVNKPFANQIVDSDTFNKALNVVPNKVKQDFIEAYGSGVLDIKGRPFSTVGNLQRMELELKDFITQPKFADKISAIEYNFAEAAKKLKAIRLSQLPEEAQKVIRGLDGKFGEAIKISDELLPKLMDKNGKINTRYLFNTYKNPGEAGTRTYLDELKKVGINLTQEIKVMRGWVARQKLKNTATRIGDRIVEGGVIGGVLRGGY